jgi:hypothetical protein
MDNVLKRVTSSRFSLRNSITYYPHGVYKYVPSFFFICIVRGGSKIHSTLRPLNGLLCQPRVIMIMEKSVE